MTDLPSGSPISAGSLTSVMRAASPALAAKVLRVGIVHRGKVIDERVAADREHVTIGPNERATFVVTAAGLPPNFRLFERVGDHYELHVTRGMTGRIAQSAAPVDLDSLCAGAPIVDLPGGHGRAHCIRLADDARGKVSIGEFTILFQFVAPIPAAGKPQLPLSVKSSLGGDVDWRTSVIAAFSFLVHFGAVGSVYSDWMDPVVDDEVETSQIIESVKQLPAPPPIEHPKDTAPSGSAVANAPAAKPAAGGGGRVAQAGNTGGGGRIGDARAHQISRELASLELQVLTGLNQNSGSATAVVLGPAGALPLGMLDQAAQSAAGVRSGGVPGLDLGGGTGGPLRPGALPRGPIGGNDTAAVAPSSAGSAVAVRGPSGTVAVPPPVVTGGFVSNASAVVASMAPGFRRCYRMGLEREDPTMKGTVRVTAKIGPNGEVTSASAAGSGTLSASVIACIRARVASGQFAAPEGGGATLVIPVSAYPQQ